MIVERCSGMESWDITRQCMVYILRYYLTYLRLPSPKVCIGVGYSVEPNPISTALAILAFPSSSPQLSTAFVYRTINIQRHNKNTFYIL